MNSCGNCPYLDDCEENYECPFWEDANACGKVLANRDLYPLASVEENTND